MKISYKLILLSVMLITAAALPLSLFILERQEREKIDLIVHQAEINCRILARSTLNIILMNGADIPSARVDAKEMMGILRPLTGEGLIYADSVLLSSRERYNGILLAQFRNEEILRRGPYAGDRLSAAQVERLAGAQGFTRVRFAGIEDNCYQFVAAGTLPGRGPLCLGRLVFSERVILESTRRLRNLIYLVTAGAIIAVSIAAFLFSGIISRPIQQLTSGVERIEAGDFSYQVPVRTRDEMGKLGQTFNHMVRMLNLQIVELVSVNRSLTRVDRLKDEFMANMSHELRSPLNGIIGLAESLIEGAGGALEENARHDLSLIISSATRLSYLVNDILDFSKLKHKDISLNLATLDLHPLVRLVLSLVKPLSRNKAVSIINEIPPETVFVLGDENRLQQILLNLVGNAIKFTGDGEIRIRAVCHDERPDLVVVTVEDTGIGIPEEQQERIFESFEQVDGSITRKFGGTGLGLAITRKLVELHDGEIWVESEPGKGSRFQFTLRAGGDAPARKKEDEDRRRAFESIMDLSMEDVRLLERARPLPDQDQKTIMVVDDEPVNLQVLVNHLSLEGYRIVTALNGEEALALLDRELPDLLLLDVMLPRMSGYEVCASLRERFSPHDLPVLMLTAKSKPEDIVAGLEAGANDYLAKPVNRKELVARVNGLISLKENYRVHNELTVIKRDIQIAHDIQNTILLQEIPASEHVRIAMRYRPMTELGGDFYDVQLLEQSGVRILMADVSGHGIPAAFICAMLKVVYSFHSGDEVDPADLMTKINGGLFRFLGNQFLTACYAVIDVERMQLRQSNAGHWPLMVLRGGEVLVDRTNGIPVGWDEESTYQTVETGLETGDRIVIYTDGIVEARDHEQRMYGEARLREALVASRDLPPDDQADRIIGDVRQWAGLRQEEELGDDVTLCIAEITKRGSAGDATGNTAKREGRRKSGA
jgi:signal transduction histidine kinase/serine phosphatase RsbU (regulator of sigma subunit)